MPTKILDDVLKLPKKDKVKLYYALQQDLDLEDDYLAEDDLTKSQWKELNRRIKEIETGKANLIPWEEAKKTLDEKIKSLRGKAGRKSA
ncbi:MAG: addiction module protein [Chitinophagaceae bacterium]|nr:addiction module protein [Chitinophagaceae bacterium]